MQQVAKEAASMVLIVATTAMVAPTATTNVPKGLSIVEVCHKMTMAQILEVKPSTFVGDGKA